MAGLVRALMIYLPEARLQGPGAAAHLVLESATLGLHTCKNWVLGGLAPNTCAGSLTRYLSSCCYKAPFVAKLLQRPLDNQKRGPRAAGTDEHSQAHLPSLEIILYRNLCLPGCFYERLPAAHSGNYRRSRGSADPDGSTRSCCCL